MENSDISDQSDLSRWHPHGELPSQTASWISEFLADEGVPRKVITIFQAAGDDPPAADLHIPDNAILLGYSWEEPVCADCRTGAVYIPEIGPDETDMQVNSSIKTFVASLDYVGGRYPFRVPEKTIPAAMAVAAELKARLEEIDSSSTIEPDGFWGSFLSDVANGDYSSS